MGIMHNSSSVIQSDEDYIRTTSESMPGIQLIFIKDIDMNLQTIAQEYQSVFMTITVIVLIISIL